MKHAFLIAAASSGSGKTTLTFGLLRALQARGLKVQPFKCGPDFIDPQYHAIACGTPSVNLDTWMNGSDSVRRVFAHFSSQCDVSVCEGVMGLYDGADRMKGSCAEVAELLHLPVILVLDARSMAYSAAPLLYGYRHFREETNIAGVIFNKVGSERHYDMLRQAAEAVGMPCLGYLPRSRDMYSPSRHLGLDLSERGRIDDLASEVAGQIVEHVDLDALLRIAEVGESLPPSAGIFLHEGESCTGDSSAAKPSAGTIYVARDDAFSFIYHETVCRLSTLGRVRFFSPLANEAVGEDAAAVYIPGGYPEFFLPQLAASTVTMQSLRQSKAPIVAECGGMMYLSQGIDEHGMTGLLPFSTTMRDARLHLGYRTFQLGEVELRGHEFHYSDYCQPTPPSPVYHEGRLWASYIHFSPSSLQRIVAHMMGRGE